MKKLQTLICAGLFALTGCPADKKVDTQNLKIEQLEKGPEMVDYFSKITIDDTVAITSGDYNNDGNSDSMIIFDDEMQLYLGDGEGNFKLEKHPYNGEIVIDDAVAIASGYYNKDKNLDLMVVFDDEARVYLGDGKGNFKLKQYEKKE